jgi:hypothetical protein
MYFDRVKPDSKQRLEKFLELNKPYGMTGEDLNYLLFSNMIFIFLNNAEEFRSVFLFIMKLPVQCSKRRKIDKKTGLGQLLRGFREMQISKSAILLKDIDYTLRNCLSHGLYWFDSKDSHYHKPHLHYSTDITFKKVVWINIADLYVKMRRQSLYTNCLLNVIANWFQ